MLLYWNCLFVPFLAPSSLHFCDTFAFRRLPLCLLGGFAACNLPWCLPLQEPSPSSAPSAAASPPYFSLGIFPSAVQNSLSAVSLKTRNRAKKCTLVYTWASPIFTVFISLNHWLCKILLDIKIFWFSKITKAP